MCQAPMGLDYVDLFYHHRPDPETPLEETMTALDQMVRSGKALYVGISNYNQVRYSLFDRHIERDGLKGWAAANGVGLIAFSPLAQGLLTDRYLEGTPDDSRIRKDGRFLKESALTPDALAQFGELINTG
jgi:L-glyceraldehyde 3-phosphate reductase